MPTVIQSLVAVIADPIDHLRTPDAMNMLFARREIAAVALPFHVSAGCLPRVVDAMRGIRNLKGAVITMPHKIEAARLCDELGEEAQKVGAVNAVSRLPDGRLRGENFDGLGMVAGLRSERIEPADHHVLLVGAGGAAAAIGFALAGAGVRSLTIENRSAEKAEALARSISAAYPHIDIKGGRKDRHDQTLVINATSLGLRETDALPLDVASLPFEAIVAEVIMQPEETALLAAAHRRGLRVHAGRHMLTHQLELLTSFVIG